MSFRRSPYVLLTALVLALAPACLAADEPSKLELERANVRVTIKVGRIENGQKKIMKSYELLTPASGTLTRLSTGQRIPIPTRTVEAGEKGDSAPQTSFSYQNVGFSAGVRAKALGDGLVHLTAEIDDSSLTDPSALTRPGRAFVMGSFQQMIDTVVREGVPVTSTLVDDPGNLSLYIEIGADIQG